ncbi:MAG TPA: DUF305 domain-containing protein [Flavisolibacter sp.]|nr:DUF305 domain-containing protein [Flavisolibacter sp.]
MKKIVSVLALFYALTACNQGEQQSANNNISDTSAHSARGDNASNAATADGGNVGESGEKTLMAIMENNLEQVKNLRSLGSNDHDFAAMMKIHHMGAIEMAELQMARGTDPQLKQMAQGMISQKQAQLRELDAFINNNNQNTQTQGNSSAFYNEVKKEIEEINTNIEESGTMDQQFAQMMIPHHRGGIALANLYLKTGAQEKNLKTLANNISSNQQKEIQQLQSWVSKNKSTGG